MNGKRANRKCLFPVVPALSRPVASWCCPILGAKTSLPSVLNHLLKAGRPWAPKCHNYSWASPPDSDERKTEFFKMYLFIFKLNLLNWSLFWDYTYCFYISVLNKSSVWGSGVLGNLLEKYKRLTTADHFLNYLGEWGGDLWNSKGWSH